ncbi:MAG: glycosyltransferase family 2 protein [Treponema sp.]|nr:glycosyltransferase family 2 protein [Treponema sp.]
MKKTITAHTLVKNEDRFVWFAIMSVIDYVDKMIIFDTGSTDNTVSIIQNIIDSGYSDKIIFEEKGFADRNRIGQLRQEMIEKTETDYFLVLDGDEIWWKESIEELVSIANSNEKLFLLAQHYINCAKDIRHYRKPGRDVYAFLDTKETATIRLYSMKIPGIHCGGYYGIEGFFDGDNNEVQCGKYEIKWQKNKYLHTSYLQRSSNQNKDLKVYSRLGKMFLTYDYKFPKDYKYPEVFYAEYPSIVRSPFKRDIFSLRTFVYFLLDTLHLRVIVNLFRKNRYRED